MEAMEANSERPSLCRLCATITTHPNQRVDIFAVDGLRTKIETCLPVHVHKHSDLPDTLCSTCHEKIDAFYDFRKRAIETLIILEDKYRSVESCFNKPNKVNKSTVTDNIQEKSTDHSEYSEWKSKKLGEFCMEAESHTTKVENEKTLLNCALQITKAEEILGQKSCRLVDYDSDEESQTPKTPIAFTSIKNKRYFDDKVNDIISEIVERKSIKRKLEQSDNGPSPIAKIFKLDESSSSRRKKRPPIKRSVSISAPVEQAPPPPPPQAIPQCEEEVSLPQVCLLCDQQFNKGSSLARHVFDVHGIDMAQVMSSEPIPEMLQRSLQSYQHFATQVAQQQVPEPPPPIEVHRSPKSPKTTAEKKKKLPELVKITDLKSKRESIDVKPADDAPPTLTASYVCPLCPASLTNRTDLYAHLRTRHSSPAKLICGLCLHIATTLPGLQEHLELCTKTHAITGYLVCQICKYSEDNHKSLENHILVHDFLLLDCKKDGRIFDPADFVDTNTQVEPKTYICGECGYTALTFKEFSSHKRSEHSIFHCDLCNKSYGRNSHLWKHVNRVHKGHPSVTCQFCHKTSASKYHLLQHFNKIHTQKSTTAPAPKLRNNGELIAADLDGEEDFMSRKFEGFDFQSVRQSFMRQELEKAKPHSEAKKVHRVEFAPLPTVSAIPPKELDSSSTIYTNIITNYTPPNNDGEYKCPKCSKAFHKRTLLKKHKKNCRPRLQKDLLTRCKSCSRIFKDRQSLAKHLVNYHSEYSCEMCAEKVQSKCEIVSHIRFTHPGCHLICHDCGNVLRNNDLLRAHLADHANSFVCQFCGDILPSKIKLKMHILSLHRKILSLSCGVCLKLFENQHILRDHVRLVHRQVLQPLTSCTVCGKNYGSKWKTYDHLNKSHGRVFKACKICLEVFNNEQELQVHVDTAHAKGMKKLMANHMSGELRDKDDKLDDYIDNGGGMGLEDDGQEDTENDSENEDSQPEVESKSILEKHLIGAYRSTNQNQKLVNGGNTPTTPKMKIKIASVTPSTENDALINSSKRTVYVNSNDPSVCEICHKNWPAKKHLWQHYIRCHKQVAATVCGICLCTNENYEALQKHLHREHPTLLHGKGFGSNFICRICGRYHNASSKLRLHMAIHIKFDWTLLDRFEATNGSQAGETNEGEGDEEEDEEAEDENENEHDEQPQLKNVKEEVAEDGINYESLIEQVECSTNSSSSSSESDEEDEDDENEDHDDHDEQGEADESIEQETVEHEEDDDDEDEDEDEDEDVEEEGEVEVEADQDQENDFMEAKIEEIKSEEQPCEEAQELEQETDEYEEQIVEEPVYEEIIEDVTEEIVPDDDDEMEEEEYVAEEIFIKHVVGDDDDEGDEQELEEDEEVIEHDEEEIEEDEGEEVDDTSSNTSSTQIEESQMEISYVQDPDVVDSAVKSICYDANSCHVDASSQEYEVQSTHNLNQHEIQSAVDSIL